MKCRRKTVLLLIFLLSYAIQACSQMKGDDQQRSVFRVSDQKKISYAKMVDDLKQSQLIFVGETHDNMEHHRLQLEVIRSLHDVGLPLAVGFEMFTARSQNILDKWVAGTISQDEFIKTYYENWNFPWPYYRDILVFVRDKRIPALGLNVEPAITRKVARAGFDALTSEERAHLPPDVGCAVDKHFMEFVRRAYAMHGHSNDKTFLFFCQAQLLWDQVMARNILRFLEKNPERRIVVITGNGHAWKRGIPEHIRLLSDKIRYRVILPVVPGHIDEGIITKDDADYLLRS